MRTAGRWIGAQIRIASPYRIPNWRRALKARDALTLRTSFAALRTVARDALREITQLLAPEPALLSKGDDLKFSPSARMFS